MASINEGEDVVALVRRNALLGVLRGIKPWYLVYLYKYQHWSCDFVDCVPESTMSCDIHIENASHTTEHVHIIIGNKIVRMRLPQIKLWYLSQKWKLCNYVREGNRRLMQEHTLKYFQDFINFFGWVISQWLPKCSTFKRFCCPLYILFFFCFAFCGSG